MEGRSRLFLSLAFWRIVGDREGSRRILFLSGCRPGVGGHTGKGQRHGLADPVQRTAVLEAEQSTGARETPRPAGPTGLAPGGDQEGTWARP